MSDLLSSGISSGLSVLGGLINTGANATAQDILNERQFQRQKELIESEHQYYNESNRMARMIAAGLTPAAAAQSIAGSNNSGSTPVVSGSSAAPSSMPDLGASFMNAKLKDSEILTNEALAYKYGVESSNLDAYYKAMVYELNNRARLHGNQGSYFQEFAKTMAAKRPWEISTLAAGLKNLAATYSNILQDTRTKQAEQKNLEAQTITEGFKQSNIAADTGVKGAEYLNLNLEGYRLQFESDLRSAGINPSSRFGDNLLNLMVTNPWKASRLLDNCSEFAADIDTRLMNLLGKNYKKKIRLALAGYYGYKLKNTLEKNFLGKLNSLTGTIGNLVPFAHPAPISPTPYFGGFNSSITY